MEIENVIGLDSQCLSYLIDAMQGVEEPSGDLAAEKVALFRTYLYTPGTLFVTRTVVDECARIRDVQRRELHDSYIGVLFGEWQLQDEQSIHSRAKDLESHHRGEFDCRILAEAEEARFSALLSFDGQFVTHLSELTIGVQLTHPSSYWVKIGICIGAKPDKIPHSTNPLANEDWWRW